MRAFLFCDLVHTIWITMPRKPNYDFERRERDKARAAKKAERQRLKKEKADLRKETANVDSGGHGPGAGPSQPPSLNPTKPSDPSQS